MCPDSLPRFLDLRHPFIGLRLLSQTGKRHSWHFTVGGRGREPYADSTHPADGMPMLVQLCHGILRLKTSMPLETDWQMQEHLRAKPFKRNNKLRRGKCVCVCTQSCQRPAGYQDSSGYIVGEAAAQTACSVDGQINKVLWSHAQKHLASCSNILTLLCNNTAQLDATRKPCECR